MLPRLALLSLLTLSACDFLAQLRDPQSDPQPLELVAEDAFYGDGSEIVGGGASPFVAYTRWDTNAGTWSVRLVRHDAALPDVLEVLADVSAGSVLAVEGNVAVLWVAGDLVVIDLASAELTTRTVSTPSAGAERVAVSGRWLLVAAGTSLALADLDAAAYVGAFTAPAPVTAVLATQGAFLAFTTTGYVHVTPDPGAPTFSAVTDPLLRNFRAAFADGSEAIVAGPSPALGRSRVVRLDLASPAAPVALRSHEVAAPYAFFAWDGGATSVLATRSSSREVREGYVIHEAGEAFTTAGIPLPSWWRDGNPIAAHGGRLFALGYGGLGMYRINR